MNGLEMILVLLVGLAIGAALGWMLARSRDSGARARADAAEERAAYIEEQLADRFRALSAQALDATNQRFLELAEGRMRAVGAEAGNDLEQRKQAVERLVEPLQKTLEKVEGQLREADAGRRTAHAELAKQVEFVREGSERLCEETRSLVTALRRPEARGRWGELQLRRVAELSGMSAYCDFEEQASVRTEDGAQRPDMVVRLSGGKSIVVDSKVSLAAYLEAAEADDEARQADRMRAHAKHLRAHVDQLSSKAYWKAFSPAPEFVVLFIPGEAFLAPALEQDAALLEYAMARRVHIATPTTLVSLLRTAQYAWQQEALSQNAREVFELGKQLHARLSTLGGHVDGLGRALSKAVTAYNQTVGSLESRVLVTARRFEALGLVDGELDRPSGIEEQARPLASAELSESAGAADGAQPQVEEAAAAGGDASAGAPAAAGPAGDSASPSAGPAERSVPREGASAAAEAAEPGESAQFSGHRLEEGAADGGLGEAGPGAAFPAGPFARRGADGAAASAPSVSPTGDTGGFLLDGAPVGGASSEAAEADADPGAGRSGPAERGPGGHEQNGAGGRWNGHRQDGRQKDGEQGGEASRAAMLARARAFAARPAPTDDPDTPSSEEDGKGESGSPETPEALPDGGPSGTDSALYGDVFGPAPTDGAPDTSPEKEQDFSPRVTH